MGEDDLKALRRRYGVVGDAYGSSVGSGEVGVSSVSGSLRDEDARALAHMLSLRICFLL